jgi:uncharacterized protein (DUF1501 family)
MKHESCNCEFGVTRRAFLRSGMTGFGAVAASQFFLQETSLAMAVNAFAGQTEKHPNRILVVLELTGGNCGLNTVVPYTNDEYYRLRPTLAVQKNNVRKVSDEFGFHPNLVGFERMFKEGHLAVVHGCSYPNPDRSHFVSMGYWHTAVPNGADSRGWVGRFADAYSPQPQNSFIINIAREQSMAVKSGVHAPVVFSDPDRFVRDVWEIEKETLAKMAKDKPATGNDALMFLRNISATADQSSEFVRRACAEYRSKLDYGYGPIGVDLRRVVALIKAKSPARIYYLNFGNFDTHASQAGAQSGLFNQTGDAVMAFLDDLKAIGRAEDVAVVAFSEFGRRVKENASFGTDHGVAGPMFVFGHRVKGGFYGQHPSLTDLDEGDLKMTTDFRAVYATMIKEWMGYDDPKTILKGDFPALGLFG